MFQFKQFMIHQDRCAMKVTEMACLLGALTPVEGVKRVLDIGFGTGVLSLMLAQRNRQCRVEAIEIDEEAFHQGRENIMASPFRDQITCYFGNIMNFNSPEKYDLIICNPPFFEHHLSSSNERKNKAWHSLELSLDGLWMKMAELLNDSGTAFLLLPEIRRKEVEELNLQHGFHTKKVISIHHRLHHDTGLRILFITRRLEPCIYEDLILRESDHYTKETQLLFRDYYLKL